MSNPPVPTQKSSTPLADSDVLGMNDPPVPTQAPTKPPMIKDGGDETPDIEERRKWFAAQALGNVERLESAGQTILQLVTGLYASLFIALTLQQGAQYLADGLIQVLSIATGSLLFLALGGALWVLFPRSYNYKRDSITQMENQHKHILEHKKNGLYFAISTFGAGMLFLFILLIRILLILPTLN
jgi:hypothetical protein